MAKFQQIRQQLENEMATACAHTRIRPRRDLMISYGASRSTIDRAIAELIREGRLYTKVGSGTFVGATDTLPSPGMKSLGLLLPDIRHYTYPGIMRGVEHVCIDRDINLIVGNIENKAARQTHYLRNFINTQVSGIIIVPARPNAREDLEGHLMAMLKELDDLGVPFVICNRLMPDLQAPQVIPNDFHGGFLATSHLIRQGYRRIAYISHPPYITSLSRHMGYLSALQAKGMTPAPELTVFSRSWRFETPGRQELTRLLNLPKPPDAVFCFTDNIAKGAAAAVTEKGLRVGRDLGIVGYDDSTVCKSLDVPLTSVRVNAFELGRLAARMLFTRLAGRANPPCRVLPPQLVVRDSTRRSSFSNPGGATGEDQAEQGPS